MIEENTYDSCIRQFNKYLEDYRLELSVPNLFRFFGDLQEWFSISTVHVYKNAIKKSIEKTFLGNPHYFEFKAALEQVFKEVKTGRRDSKIYEKDLISEEEIEQLLEGGVYEDFRCKPASTGRFKEIKADDKLKLIIRFLASTGMRIHELILLEIKRCQVEEKFVRIDFTGKGKKERRNYIPKNLYEAAIDTFQGRTYVFQDEGFMPVEEGLSYSKRKELYVERYRKNVLYRLRNLSKKLLGKEVTPHDFRHFFATKWLKEGKSLKAIANWLGHSTTAITADMYIHDELRPEELFGFESEAK